MHDRRIVWNGMLDLHLVRPPIGEGGSCSTVCLHLVSYLVAFEDVREGVEGEAHPLSHFHGSVDLALHIRVASDEALAIHDLHQGIQFQIPADGAEGIDRYALLGRLSGSSGLLQGSLIEFGTLESIGQYLLDTHAAVREPGIALGGRTALNILSEGELDETGCTGKLEFLIIRAPAEFDELRLATNGIGASVQDM